MKIRDILALEIAKGIAETGIEGSYDSVSCSTAGDYPSMGISQWEGCRGDDLLSKIDGGSHFCDRSYSDIVSSGELPELRKILASAGSKNIQQQLLAQDCLRYVDKLQWIPTLDDTRCFIYAGMWCPTSEIVVSKFLRHRWPMYNLRSLKQMRDVFKSQYYVAADVGEQYAVGYANRAEVTYQYVAGIDLTTLYGIPEYGKAGNGR